MVASFETFAGAARMALAINWASLGAFAAAAAGSFFAVSAAETRLAAVAAIAAIIRQFIKRRASINPSQVRTIDRRGCVGCEISS
jgi:hypothetical protein